MNTTRRYLATATLAVALGLALTGCGTNAPTASSSAAASVSASSAPVAVTETPAPVETTPAVAAPVAGATITTDAEAAAAKAAGLGVFDTYDASGTYVNSLVFALDAPLPEPVKAAIAAPVAAATEASRATGITGDTVTNAQKATNEAILQTAQAKATAASKATGHDVIVIYSKHSSADGGVHWGWVWCPIGGTGSAYKPATIKAAFDRDALVAQTQAWVAAQPNPAGFEIVVAG